MTDIAWASAARAAGARLRAILLGRYSRGAWALATLGLTVALGVMVTPLASYLWTSPRFLRDVYTAYAIGVAAVCAVVMILVFAKRLQDQNLNGLWALPIVILLPWGLLSAAQAWVAHLYKSEQVVNSGAYYNAAAILWLALILLVALRPSRPSERFGPRTDAAAVLRPRHPVTALCLATLSLLVATSLYAGFFQDGLWVGRQQDSFFSGPAVRTPGGGNVLATCGNAKGVSASAGGEAEGGFVRDAVSGAWSVIVLPDGTLDIQTFSDRQVLSYQEDGFSVSGTGVRLTSYGSLARDVERFMVVARASNRDLDTIATMSFVRRPYGYSALIAQSRTVGKGSLLADKNARASSMLMIADCTVAQEYTPERAR